MYSEAWIAYNSITVMRSRLSINCGSECSCNRIENRRWTYIIIILLLCVHTQTYKYGTSSSDHRRHHDEHGSIARLWSQQQQFFCRTITYMVCNPRTVFIYLHTVCDIFITHDVFREKNVTGSDTRWTDTRVTIW